jgi:hypothetical protein
MFALNNVMYLVFVKGRVEDEVEVRHEDEVEVRHEKEIKDRHNNKRLPQCLENSVTYLESVISALRAASKSAKFSVSS